MAVKTVFTSATVDEKKNKRRLGRKKMKKEERKRLGVGVKLDMLGAKEKLPPLGYVRAYRVKQSSSYQ